MTINPSDTKKLVGLLVGVVLVISFIAYQLMGSSSPSPSPAGTAPVQAVTAPPAAEGTPVATTEDAATSGQVEVLPTQPTGPANPFRTVGPSDAGTPTANTAPVKSAAPVSEAPPALSGQIMPVLPTVDSKVDAPVSVLASLGLRVDGVILSGSDSVAVISAGSESYVVKVGEKFSDKVRLVSVSNSVVKLARGKETITLKVGS